MFSFIPAAIIIYLTVNAFPPFETIVTVLMAVLENADVAILSIVSGMVILVIVDDYAKAESPIVLTPEPIITFVKYL